MPSFVVLLLVLLVSGCATDSFVAHPLGGGQYLVQRAVSDPHAWATTVQTSWLEYCAGKTVPAAWGSYSNLELFDCKQEGPFKTFTQTGYVSGVLAPTIGAAGMVGAGALIGDGLKKSGSTTSNNIQGGMQSQSVTQSQSSSVRVGH
jgi:hypothetical protein